MRKIVLLAGIVFTMIAKLQAQDGWNSLPMDKMFSKDTIVKDGFTLVFLNQDPEMNPQVKQKMIDAFFTVYPKEVAEYNPKSNRKVIFFIDSSYKDVAATGAGVVHYNPKWFHKHPQDIDVVTHEVMHIVQAYPGNAGPGWLTEGIADYVRAEFGVNNAGASWLLPAYRPDQSYTNAYRVTARFLIWLEKNNYSGIVVKLDAAMRSRKYNDGLWKKITGKTVDELWADYGKNPAI